MILKYGGNPVSCAIANAVMNVIESEKLQENALKVGNYLLDKCIALKRDFEIVGDVRGWGLFVGLEIVSNKETRLPAKKEAQWIVDRMKNVHHVLISSDGPDDNVLKLKPPMVFNQENADEFLTAITECLNTLHLQEVLFDNLKFAGISLLDNTLMNVRTNDDLCNIGKAVSDNVMRFIGF